LNANERTRREVIEINELVPIVCGLLLGSLLGRMAASLRLPVGLVVAVLIGVVATLVGGEFRTSWAFIAVDIPGAILATACGYLLLRHFARARAASRQPRA
jgi:uncharacterized membrane protein YeaQ/YmgE (transglycosylase-associated protein family)